jgi:hypothetical protein
MTEPVTTAETKCLHCDLWDLLRAGAAHDPEDSKQVIFAEQSIGKLALVLGQLINSIQDEAARAYWVVEAHRLIEEEGGRLHSDFVKHAFAVSPIKVVTRQ